jgi:hypothetical protein
MPGDTLMAGVARPHTLEEVNPTYHSGLFATQVGCISGMWETNKGVLALTCVLNACVQVACADVKWNDEGIIYSCDIYTIADWMIEHEERHCMGYADLFY